MNVDSLKVLLLFTGGVKCSVLNSLLKHSQWLLCVKFLIIITTTTTTTILISFISCYMILWIVSLSLFFFNYLNTVSLIVSYLLLYYLFFVSSSLTSIMSPRKGKSICKIVEDLLSLFKGDFFRLLSLLLRSGALYDIWETFL